MPLEVITEDRMGVDNKRNGKFELDGILTYLEGIQGEKNKREKA